MQTNQQYIQISKVAKRLDCSHDFIRGLIADRQLEAINLGQRATRVSVESLNRFLEQAKIDPDKYTE